MAKFTSIIGNSQKLDGGAMFGNVPKTIWSQWMMPDEKNRVTLACRALLIQQDNKNILLETGIGAFFNPVLRERYGVMEEDHILLQSLQKKGLSHTDIDFVILSHLHFDHAGGLLSKWEDGKAATLLFPNARYLVSQSNWERACHPHPRDRASFVPELNQLLAQSQRLVIIENETNDLLGQHFRFMFTEGHTPGLMHTVFQDNNQTVIFASDLIPGLPWVHVPVSMGYDRSPECLIDEKKKMLEFAIKENAQVFYTHDPQHCMSRITQDEKGKFIPVDVITG